MEGYPQFESILVERHDRILTCTLNRPQSLNAVDDRLHHELEELFAAIAVDEETDAVVLTGAGRAFCAGGDVKGMARGELSTARQRPGGLFTRGAVRLIRNLLSVPQPMIASLNGDAIGLGATIALLCDVVLAAEHARIGDPHVKVGLVAGDGGAVIWPLLVGANRAKEYLMTGDLVAASEAERIGLVNHVYPADQLEAATRELAARLANGATAAIRWTKQSVNKALWDRMNLILDTSLVLEGLSAATDDHHEAARAFTERRPPKFTGY